MAAIGYDLRAEIRARLLGDVVDPHEIARLVAGDMPEYALRDLAAMLVANEVRAVMRADRKHTPTSSPRWAAAARLNRSRLDMGWSIGDEWKRLRDCTRADVEWLVADYANRAESNITWRDAFQAVKDAMEQREVLTVGELPDGFVDRLLP